MANLTSSLTVKLIDDVSKPARTVAQALKEAEKAAEGVAKGMGKSGSDPFRRQLAGLKLTATELRDVRKEWLLYARAQKQAMGGEAWAAKGAATMRTWERQSISSLRAVRKEQMAFQKSLIAGKVGGRMAGMRGAASDFASFALPGAAGMMMGMGGAAIGGAAVGGAATYGMKQAISFDKAMANVRKKVNLDPGKSMADVEEIINKASRSMGMARTEAADMAATAGAAGVGFKDLSSFIDLTAKSATAFDMPAKEAAQAIAEVRAQTGWTNEQLKTFADKVNYLGDSSAAAEKDVLGMFQRSAAAAKASGVDFDTSLAAMTALRSGGMDESVSARFFANFAQRLRVAGQLGKKSAAGFKELGLSVEEVRKGMQTDAQGTMLKFLERLDKSPDKIGVGLKIFGQEWSDEAARFTQVIPEMRRLMEGLRAGTFQGSLDQALKIDLDTTEKKFERLKAAASELADTLARPMLPGLNSALDAATSKIESWLKPKGPSTAAGSLSNYEDRLGLNKPAAPAAPPTPTFQAMPGAGLSRKNWALQGPSASVMGGGNISANNIPAFSRMQGAAPSIDTSSLDAAKAKIDIAGTAITKLSQPVSVNVDSSALDAVPQKANSAQGALQGVAAPVSVHVDSSSIDAAIAKANQLKATLSGIGAAAGAAASAAGTAAASASAAAARVSSAAKTIRAGYAPSSGQAGQ